MPAEPPAPARDLDELDPEDRKILVLARAARARTGAAEGACVRDTDGRTYAAATVDLPSLRLSAVQVAVATAVSSGVQGLEAVAVVGDDEPAPRDGDLAVVRDVAGAGIPVLLAGPDGSLVEATTT